MLIPILLISIFFISLTIMTKSKRVDSVTKEHRYLLSIIISFTFSFLIFSVIGICYMSSDSNTTLIDTVDLNSGTKVMLDNEDNKVSIVDPSNTVKFYNFDLECTNIVNSKEEKIEIRKKAVFNTKIDTIIFGKFIYENLFRPYRYIVYCNTDQIFIN